MNFASRIFHLLGYGRKPKRVQLVETGEPKITLPGETESKPVFVAITLLRNDEKGAIVVIRGEDQELALMLAVALRQNKRFLHLFRAAFRSANLPIK
jgi:hypothetical protein